MTENMMQCFDPGISAKNQRMMQIICTFEVCRVGTHVDLKKNACSLAIFLIISVVIVGGYNRWLHRNCILMFALFNILDGYILFTLFNILDGYIF